MAPLRASETTPRVRCAQLHPHDPAGHTRRAELQGIGWDFFQQCETLLDNELR